LRSGQIKILQTMKKTAAALQENITPGYKCVKQGSKYTAQRVTSFGVIWFIAE
jgi:hypothetical protein